MLRLHQLELSLDDAATFDPSCLRRLCAQRLHLSEKAVAEARLVKRSVDARSRGGVHFSLTADVALAQGGEAEEKRLASRFKPNQVTVIIWLRRIGRQYLLLELYYRLDADFRTFPAYRRSGSHCWSVGRKEICSGECRYAEDRYSNFRCDDFCRYLYCGCLVILPGTCIEYDC